MLIKGWVIAEWEATAGNRRARYYQLTAAGRKQLATEISQFERFGELVRRLSMLFHRGQFDAERKRCGYISNRADPVSLLAAVGILLLVAAIAGYLPARRASLLDPMVALRCE